jgi:hypothetical protein
MYRGMSDETLDGIIFGMALASNPKVKARREAYYNALRKDREMLSRLSRETLASAIEARRLWTLPGVIEKKTTAEMIGAISRCMQGNDRAAWLSALGQEE